MAKPEWTYPSTSSEWNIAFLSYEAVICRNNDKLKLAATIKLERLLHRAPRRLLLLTVPILIRLLEDSEGPLQESAACCLKRIICADVDHELAMLFSEPRTVASLVRILALSDGRCQKHLIQCIWSVVTYLSESRMYIFESGGLEVVIELLSSSTDGQRRRQLLEILSALALVREVRRALVSLGKLHLLIEAAKFGSLVSKERAAQAIGLLGVTRRTRCTLVSLGVIPTLVELFQDGDYGTKLVAGNALGVISSHVDYIRRVSESGVIPLYAELLQGPEQIGREIAEDVFCILAVIESNAVEIVNHLVRILRDENAEVRTSAADVLWDLSGYKYSIPVIHESGVIPILVQLLSDEDDNVREKVSGAIAQLSYSEIDRFALAEAGVIPCLIEMLQAESEEVRDNAAESLINFADDPVHCERMSQVFDLPAFQNMQQRMVHIRAADQHMASSLSYLSTEQLIRDPMVD